MIDTVPVNRCVPVLLLVCSRLSQCLLLPSDGLCALTMRDRLVACVLSGFLIALLTLPAVFWLRHRTLTDAAYARSRFLGRTVGVAVVALCLWVLVLDVAHLSAFVDTAVQHSTVTPALVPALVAAAFAASGFGLAALQRAAAPVAVLTVVLLAVIGLCLLPQSCSWYLPTTTVGGWPAVCRQALAELPRTAEVLTVVLLPRRRLRSPRRTVRAYLVFAAVTAAVTAAVCLTALGVLGDFAAVTAYPYHTAVAAAQLGVLERPDIVITGIWLGTSFVRLTLFATLLCRQLHRRLGSRRVARLAGTIAAALVCVTASAVRTVTPATETAITVVYAAVLVLFCWVLPAALTVRLHRTERRNRP